MTRSARHSEDGAGQNVPAPEIRDENDSENSDESSRSNNCAVEDCENTADENGYCPHHQDLAGILSPSRLDGTPRNIGKRSVSAEAPALCAVEDCQALAATATDDGLCAYHQNFAELEAR